MVPHFQARKDYLTELMSVIHDTVSLYIIPHTFAHIVCVPGTVLGPEKVVVGGDWRCTREVNSLASTQDHCSPTCKTVGLWC